MGSVFPAPPRGYGESRIHRPRTRRGAGLQSGMTLDAPRAPLLWVVLPFAAGIAATRWGGPVPGLALAAAILAAGAAWAGAGESRVRVVAWAVLLAGASALAGYVRAHAATPRLSGWEQRPVREAEVHLRVTRLFASRSDSRTRSGLGTVVAAPAHAPELAGCLVYFSTTGRGDRVAPARHGVYVVRGVLSLPPPAAEPGGFAAYLADLGVAARLQRGQVRAEVAPPGPVDRWAARTARHGATLLRHGLERHPELSGLLVAMLLGEKAALTAAQEEAFLRSGTYHVFSVSGLHVGVIAGALQALLLLLRFPRAARVVLGLLLLAFYVRVVGGHPPAVRAFIMVAFLLARGLGRLPGHPLAALAAAALTTLLLDPRQLFGAGFQLSYLVVGAIVLMGMPLAAAWQDRWRPWAGLPEADWGTARHLLRAAGRWLLGTLAITTAALLGSTPATIVTFGLFTPGALVANLVIVPLASLALIAGFLAFLAGLSGLPGLTLLFNHAAALLILVMEELVRLGTSLPLAYFPAALRAPGLAGPAMLVPLGLMLLGAARRWRGRGGSFWLPGAGLAAVLLACVRLG